MWTRQLPASSVIVAVMVVAFASGAAAQDPQAAPAAGERARPEARQGPGRAAGQQADRLDVAELQRLFDAYTVMQAQEALKLDDQQFAQFLPKLKALQDTRRRNEQAHRKIIAELARLTAPSMALDETAVRDQLRALQELESRSAAEVRRTYDAIDQQLDLGRQARFRVFEQNMERRKLQLMLRARRGAAGQQ